MSSFGCKDSYFLNKKQGEQRTFSFEDLILSLTRGHILGEKPLPSGYQPHPSDESPLEDVKELHLADFAKIATGVEDYVFPPTLNRSAIVTLLVDSTPGGMMRAVVTCLPATGVLPKPLTIPLDWEQEGLPWEAFDNIRNMDRGIWETLIQREVQNPTMKSSLAPITAPVVTRKRKQRMLRSEHSPTLQESRPPPSTAPAGEVPPPLPPVTSSSRTQTRKQKGQDTPDPMFPTQAITTSADTALSKGEHRGPYPTVVQRIAGLLGKPQ